MHQRLGFNSKRMYVRNYEGHRSYQSYCRMDGERKTRRSQIYRTNVARFMSQTSNQHTKKLKTNQQMEYDFTESLVKSGFWPAYMMDVWALATRVSACLETHYPILNGKHWRYDANFFQRILIWLICIGGRRGRHPNEDPKQRVHAYSAAVLDDLHNYLLLLLKPSFFQRILIWLICIGGRRGRHPSEDPQKTVHAYSAAILESKITYDCQRMRHNRNRT